MEDFCPEEWYNCVVLRYCIGYLNDIAAAGLLSKLSHNLVRGDQPSYILIQDQILAEEDGELVENEQRVRRESSLKNIFKQSGLTLVDEVGPEVLHEDMLPVKVWVLALSSQYTTLTSPSGSPKVIST